MIEQFRFALTPPNGVRVPQAWAYRLYGWLMEQLPPEWGAALHLQGEHPIAHSLFFSREEQTLIWTVNLLSDALQNAAVPVLEQVQTIPLHEMTLSARLLERRTVFSPEELIRSGRGSDSNRAKLTFLSPCAFKQCGRYAIFPQESLLLQSLVLHWNSAFPEVSFTDPDALQALAQGLRIVGYDLHSTRYFLKEACIPAFAGSIVLESRHAPPLRELWNGLLAFAPYGGIGIKTTLGMGGTDVAFLAPPDRQR